MKRRVASVCYSLGLTNHVLTGLRFKQHRPPIYSEGLRARVCGAQVKRDRFGLLKKFTMTAIR